MAYGGKGRQHALDCRQCRVVAGVSRQSSQRLVHPVIERIHRRIKNGLEGLAALAQDEVTGIDTGW